MDYNQLKLLYEKIYAISLEIETLTDANQYEDLLPTATRRDKLIQQLEQVKHSLNVTEEEYPDEIKEIVNILKIQELKNMERLELIKAEIKKEMEKTNKENKIISAYAPNIEASSIIDIRE